uniref:At4g15545-like C-terminal domain-containing protein n=1 Tax=Aegilops tauschii TaxID=37682 RepID=M8D4R2_AEGTA
MTQTPSAHAAAAPATAPPAEGAGLSEAIVAALPPDPYDQLELETFKRHLMQSLGDDNSSSQETVDIRTCEQSVAKASSWRAAHCVPFICANSSRDHPEDDASVSNNPAPASTTRADGSSEAESVNQEVARPFEQKLTITHMTPRLIADPAPKQRSSSAASARSKMSSAANSPPRGHSVSGRTTRIDGKEFFRQARSRLSYEQFAAFLANIKELNAHRQSQEETLEKADQIFGAENKDLLLSFQGLLSRSLT